MSPAHIHQYAASISPGQLSESLPSSQVGTAQHTCIFSIHTPTPTFIRISLTNTHNPCADHMPRHADKKHIYTIIYLYCLLCNPESFCLHISIVFQQPLLYCTLNTNKPRQTIYDMSLISCLPHIPISRCFHFCSLSVYSTFVFIIRLFLLLVLYVNCALPLSLYFINPPTVYP